MLFTPKVIEYALQGVWLLYNFDINTYRLVFLAWFVYVPLSKCPLPGRCPVKILCLFHVAIAICSLR